MGDHQSSAENGRHVPMGAKLRLATWNCGGLSYTQRELCTDLGCEILALTETHAAGYLRPNKHCIRGGTAPAGDRYAGVAMWLSDRVAGRVMHNGCCGSHIAYVEDVGLPNLEAMASNSCVWRQSGVACVECVHQHLPIVS